MNWEHKKNKEVSRTLVHLKNHHPQICMFHPVITKNTEKSNGLFFPPEWGLQFQARRVSVWGHSGGTSLCPGALCMKLSL